MSNMDDFFGKGKSREKSVDEDQKQKKMQYHTWSVDEENRLLTAVNSLGKDWNKIHHSILPQLQPIQIKNKYYTLVKRNSTSESQSSRTSEVESREKSRVETVKNDEIKNVDQKPTPNMGKPVDQDAWLNFNIFDNPDFLDFEDFMK